MVPSPVPDPGFVSTKPGRRVALLDIALLILVWAAVYLPGLGSPELRLEEPRRTAIALTMLETGHWSQPHIGGEPYYRKPPLMNWLIAASIKAVGGFSEVAARIPSVVSMLALALTAYLTGRGWMGREEGFGSALICLTCAAMIDKGRLAEIEAVYTALTGMALLIWLRGWGERGISLRRWSAIGILLGLGMMTKGPTHLLFFYGLIIPLVWGNRGLRLILSLGHLLSMVLTLLPLLGWLFLVRHGIGEAQSTWSQELVGRFS